MEKKPKGGDWVPINNYPVKEPKYSVLGLKEGQVLEFRVCAVNQGGQGKPSRPTKQHTVKDPVCKSCLITIYSMFNFIYVKITSGFYI